jgi:hypothetical protein
MTDYTFQTSLGDEVIVSVKDEGKPFKPITNAGDIVDSDLQAHIYVGSGLVFDFEIDGENQAKIDRLFNASPLKMRVRDFGAGKFLVIYLPEPNYGNPEFRLRETGEEN